jgi:hypothetical protein
VPETAPRRREARASPYRLNPRRAARTVARA